MYQKSKSPIDLSSKNVLKVAMGLGYQLARHYRGNALACDRMRTLQ